jgi:hypothetical protein
MLYLALNKESTTFSIDLINSHDIDAPNKFYKSKRCLVLTHTRIEDIIHYLLPLYYNENPREEMLRKTANRLGKELELIKSDPLVKLVEENETLKRRISVLEVNKAKGTVDIYSFIQKDYSYNKKKKLLELEQELNDTKDKIYKIKKSVNNWKELSELLFMKEQVNNCLEMEKREKNRIIEMNEKEIATTVKQLAEYKESKKKLKAQLKKLKDKSKVNEAVPGSRRRSTRNMLSPTQTSTNSRNNRLYSPNGTPRPHSSAKTNRVMGAIDRAYAESKLLIKKSKQLLATHKLARVKTVRLSKADVSTKITLIGYIS